MPGKNITVYEQLPVVGGSMDGKGNPQKGYATRGDRELEPYMECLWYLCGLIPSLEDEERTILDETRESNKNLPINAKKRLFGKGFVGKDISKLGLTRADKDNMNKMMTTSEGENKGQVRGKGKLHKRKTQQKVIKNA